MLYSCVSLYKLIWHPMLCSKMVSSLWYIIGLICQTSEQSHQIYQICLFSSIFHISIPINWIDYVNPINTIDSTRFFSCFIFICIVFDGCQMSSFLLKVSTSFPSGRVRVRPHFHLPEEDKILGKDLTCDNVRCKMTCDNVTCDNVTYDNVRCKNDMW